MVEKNRFDEEIKALITSKIEKPSENFSVNVMQSIEKIHTPQRSSYMPLLLPVIVFIAALIYAISTLNGESFLDGTISQWNEKLRSIHISSITVYAFASLTALLLIQVPLINSRRSKR